MRWLLILLFRAAERKRFESRFESITSCIRFSEEIGCGSHWIALNCPAYEKAADADMRALLEYVSTGKIDEADELVSDIANAVDAANADRKWVNDVFSVDTIQGNLERELRMSKRKLAKAEARADAAEERAVAAEARYGALVDKLLDGDRLDDLKRASSDPAFRDSLYQELHIE